MRSARSKIGKEMNFSVSKEVIGSSALPIFWMVALGLPNKILSPLFLIAKKQQTDISQMIW
jgi:hypothetical protein